MNTQKKKEPAGARFDESSIEAIVAEIGRGELSYRQAGQKYELPFSTIYRWVHRQGKEASERQPPKALSEQEMTDMELLKKQNLELAAALEKANLKVLGLETLIDVAQEQFKINIRKKRGAKQ